MNDFSLRIAVLSADDGLVDDLLSVCRARGHRVVEPNDTPDVLVADTAAGILLVREGPPRPGIARFRVVDRAASGDRLGDELELAWIGIPTSVRDADDSLDKRVG